MKIGFIGLGIMGKPIDLEKFENVLRKLNLIE